MAVSPIYVTVHYCELGNHVLVDGKTRHDLFFYSDEKNGIGSRHKAVKTCKSCYQKHLRKYYPKSNLIIKSL